MRVLITDEKDWKLNRSTFKCVENADVVYVVNDESVQCIKNRYGTHTPEYPMTDLILGHTIRATLRSK